MTQDNADHLTVLLDRAADQMQINPAPMQRILTTQRRLHRRQTLRRVAFAAVAAVMLTAGMWTGVGGAGGRVVPAGPGPEGSSPQPTSTKLDGAWTVTALAGSGSMPSALEGFFEGRVELRFDNAWIKAYTGCNWIEATYEQTGDQGQDITIKPQSSTEVGCPEEEPPLANLLSEVRHVGGAGDTRALYSDNGQTIFELARR